MRRRRFLLLTPLVVLSAVGGFLLLHKQRAAAPAPSVPTVTKPTDTPFTPSFNKNTYSLTEPSSIWFIANKHYALPATYRPSDLVVPGVPQRHAAAQGNTLRTIAVEQLKQLITDAHAAGLQLEFGSGFRSYEYQSQLYNGYVASMGKDEADRSSARPGHSEHQTGLALDFVRTDDACHLEACFADTNEGKWLATHAYEYGYLLRYPSDKESVTGYMYEPWHFRYIGKELAAEMHTQNITTLEEFFGLEAAPGYL